MDEAISDLLACSHWIVVGLRDDASRPAWQVAKSLQEQGKTIYPVHPYPETVHGRQGFSSVADACTAIVHDAGEAGLASAVVDCFVNSARVGAVVDEAIAAGVHGAWLQLGVVDDAAYVRALDAGLTAVMNRCPAIEWPR